ncbi:mCG145846, partial [Mus musculus]
QAKDKGGHVRSHRLQQPFQSVFNSVGPLLLGEPASTHDHQRWEQRLGGLLNFLETKLSRLQRPVCKGHQRTVESLTS